MLGPMNNVWNDVPLETATRSVARDVAAPVIALLANQSSHVLGNRGAIQGATRDVTVVRTNSILAIFIVLTSVEMGAHATKSSR